MKLSRIAVVGGGIIGTAVARELALRCEDATVTVFEKEHQLGSHQTGHNSGVVHAGLYYEPGSLKARLCRDGVARLIEYTSANGIPYEEVGKLVVAHTTEEVDRLEAIFERAKTNGVPHVAMLDRTRMREVEPNVRGVMALHSPHTAIVDYAALTRAFAADVEAAGGRIEYSSEVARIDAMGNEVRIALTMPGVESGMRRDAGAFDLVVTCAGLQADRLAAASGLEAEPRIVPFSGDYFVVDRPASDVVRGLIYPIPDPEFPFLGVHLTRRLDGSLLLGPNAFLSLAREKYGRGGFDLGDIGSTVGFKGFWKFASQNLKGAAREARTALSSKAFVAEVQKFVPEIDPMAVKPGPRGVRAQAMGSDGRLIDDFVISTRGRLTQVRNAPSPGATSSMAIAAHVVDGALAALR